ncbi:MAG: hypothetical protein JWN02_2347 [Acidobacteria bacterium]|nr:hypothetical protein [Acidobacteriota bacterium]
MRSPGTLADLDFDGDISTTLVDVEALDRIRKFNYLPPHEYLQFLLQFSKDLPPYRELECWDEPFEL